MLIEVVHALPGRVIAKSFRLEAGATVDDALRLAAADAQFAGVDLGHGAGIFGRLASGGAALADGDRVEIYRPLREDPRQARRARAAALSRPGRS